MMESRRNSVVHPSLFIYQLNRMRNKKTFGKGSGRVMSGIFESVLHVLLRRYRQLFPEVISLPKRLRQPNRPTWQPFDGEEVNPDARVSFLQPCLQWSGWD